MSNEKKMPKRLFSPHSVFMQEKGMCFELANALCSLLIGRNYDAYVVHGYACKDVTLKIMCRVTCPFPEEEETIEDKVEEEVSTKYALKPPRDLRSKFLMAMEQREIEKAKKEREQQEQEKLLQEQELEKPPYDELHGLRLHAWVLILPNDRDISEPLFVEASTGFSHKISSPLYCGIEAVWNNSNYWINLQDCSQGLGNLSFDLSNIKKWEHLLAGEPIHWRESKRDEDMEEEEQELNKVFDEKHLDLPEPWSLKIQIPHHVIKSRYPNGVKKTMYKRTYVEQYAPYLQEDGLITKIYRYTDLDCTDLISVEERYENRSDKLSKKTLNHNTRQIIEYFDRGREDNAKIHIYYEYDNKLESLRNLEFYHQSRFDGLQKIDLTPLSMLEDYIDREDKLYYRYTVYAKRGEPPPGFIEGPRRIIKSIVEKFKRDETKNASDDIAYREFQFVTREIDIKFHHNRGKITASTRVFIKPPLTEMVEGISFNPELTHGYQAEIGAKPPKQSTLYSLLEKQLMAEEEHLLKVRRIEDNLIEFFKNRALEKTKLEVPLFNMEQNVDHRVGMLEKEREERERGEREILEDTDYLAPYIARLNISQKVTHHQACKLRDQCLAEYKNLLVCRANDLQKQFEETASDIEIAQAWYAQTYDTLKLEEEEVYFRELNQQKFKLSTLEMRLIRHKELAPSKYEMLVEYLRIHPLLGLIETRKREKLEKEKLTI